MNKTIIAAFVAATLASGAAFAGVVAHHKMVNDVALHARVSKAETILNQNSAVNTISTHNWCSRIAFGGLLNLDARWGDNYPIGSFQSGKGNTDFTINNANLFVDAKINSWIKAHINLVYLGDNEAYHSISLDKIDTNAGDSRLSVDEVYVRMGNFAKSSFFGILGKQYVPFGHYDRYPLIAPVTQWMSQTRATAANIGYVGSKGFYGNLYALAGGTTKNNNSTTGRRTSVENFGGKIGYFGTLHRQGGSNAHYDVNASYLFNIYDSELFAPLYSASAVGGAVATAAGRVPLMMYSRQAGGLALHGDVTFGHWDFAGNFVTALRSLQFTPTTAATTAHPGWAAANGRLWSMDVNAGYRLLTLGHQSRIGMRFEWTGNGSAFNNMMTGIAGTVVNGVTFSNYSIIPHNRFVADYTVNLWHMTDASFAYAHASSYANVNGNKKDSNMIIGRLSVRF
ncbi:MAG: LbtU family siderophore porin [Gammaproteobacteria bacterium]|nr:LbtU family siderophore porin [Gammaproteobacteria bacterium]